MLTLDVGVSDTIGNVQAKIEEVSGISPDLQRLSCTGKSGEESMLSEDNIEREILDSVLRLECRVTASMKPMSDQWRVEMEANRMRKST